MKYNHNEKYKNTHETWRFLFTVGNSNIFCKKKVPEKHKVLEIQSGVQRFDIYIYILYFDTYIYLNILNKFVLFEIVTTFHGIILLCSSIHKTSITV